MDITIPSWAVFIMGAVFLPWLIWLTKQVSDNGKEIAINTANDKYVGDELKKIYEAIGNSNASMKESFSRLESRFDTFLSQEMNFLKTKL